MEKLNKSILFACAIALLSGCTSKEEISVKDKIKLSNSAYVNPTEDFEVEYSPERVIFFTPIIMDDGSIISSREVTLLPSYPVWTSKDKTISHSKTLSEYINAKKAQMETEK